MALNSVAHIVQNAISGPQVGSIAPANAVVVGLYPGQIPTLPQAKGSYLVLDLSGNYSEAGIHAGIAFLPPLMIALARANMSAGKAQAVSGLFSQIANDVGTQAPLAAYIALVPHILAVLEAQ